MSDNASQQEEVTTFLLSTYQKHKTELPSIRIQAIHIHMIPAEEYLNRHMGLELPGWWATALRKQEASTN